MEVYRMENAHHTLTHPRFDAGPVLEMYFASFDAWKKNLDAFAEGAGHVQKQAGEAPSAAGNPSNTSAHLQSAAKTSSGVPLSSKWSFGVSSGNGGSNIFLCLPIFPAAAPQWISLNCSWRS